MEDRQEVAISVQHASKAFKRKRASSIRDAVFSLIRPKSTGYATTTVLSDVSFDVRKGEVFGIIGKNGCGKSTLLKAILGTIRLDKGTIETKGKMIRLALGQGFDMDMTARQNIYLVGSLLGLSFAEIGQKFKDIIDFADVADFVDMEIKYYSTGMRNRLSFAVSQYVNADIFLMDEFFSGVGDVNFKKKSAEVFRKSMMNDKTIIFVSHNLGHLQKYCHRLMLLSEGKVVHIGDPEEVVEEYKKIMKAYGK